MVLCVYECVCLRAGTPKLLTVYSDHIISRGHQYNGWEWEFEGGGWGDKGMKENESDKTRGEKKKKYFSSQWKKRTIKPQLSSTSFPVKAHERSPFHYDIAPFLKICVTLIVFDMHGPAERIFSLSYKHTVHTKIPNAIWCLPVAIYRYFCDI